MPLRDHFHAPLADYASWEELHGMWPGFMAARLNTILPPGYRSGVRVHLGTPIEVDVGTFEQEHANGVEFDAIGGTAAAWAPASPALLLESDDLTPPEYEVRVY